MINVIIWCYVVMMVIVIIGVSNIVICSVIMNCVWFIVVSGIWVIGSVVVSCNGVGIFCNVGSNMVGRIVCGIGVSRVGCFVGVIEVCK